MTMAKIAEPKMDQMMGNVSPSISIGSIIVNPNSAASHLPIKAPINPTTMEAKHPPIEYPAILWPIPPQIAAINSKSSKPVIDIMK
jgi:hypothetical protein